MSHFYGIVEGNRSPATRCGHKSSGLHTTAASWQGAVSVQLMEQDGVDLVRVALTRWKGTGTDKVLYFGPVGDYNPMFGDQ